MIEITVEGAAEAAKVLGRLPKVTDNAADDVGNDIAVDEAKRIRARALIAGGVSRLASRSVVARKGKGITAGGGGRLASGGTYGDIFFGAEFGGGSRPRTRQFPAWAGKNGRWFHPTITADEDRIVNQWEDVLDEVQEAWNA